MNVSVRQTRVVKKDGECRETFECRFRSTRSHSYTILVLLLALYYYYYYYYNHCFSQNPSQFLLAEQSKPYPTQAGLKKKNKKIRRRTGSWVKKTTHLDKSYIEEDWGCLFFTKVFLVGGPFFLIKNSCLAVLFLKGRSVYAYIYI